MQINQVTVRGLTLGDGIPKICIPITAASLEELRGQIARILEGSADLVEWRMDYYQDTGRKDWMEQALQELRSGLGEKPVLATFRTREEGGERSISMEEYEALCIRAVSYGMADLVDVELNRGEERMQRITEQVHALGGKVIGSYHDFQKTPDREEIVRILCRMQKLGVDITKVALMPQKDRDVMTLLDASLRMKEEMADRPYITMSMGRPGAVSRLAGGLTGSALTFATAGRASAPGQMDVAALAGILPGLI